MIRSEFAGEKGQLVQVIGDGNEVAKDLYMLAKSFDMRANDSKGPLIAAFMAGIKPEKEDLDLAKKILDEVAAESAKDGEMLSRSFS